MFIVILASLDNIPDDHYETGNIYGANRLQQFRYITLPQIKSAILIAVSIRIIWNLVKISQPLQMTGGGPGYESSILAILLYRYSWERGAHGLSFAVGAVLVTFTIAFIILFINEFERESVEVRK
jgi:ABC-type sugar transport system permease subunit